ncbi:MAG: phosphatase PAP2 family protein [Candidatus Odyssella sp.]|nr:phosphatase PAP2 family protein [Candidatus Odyssella sp.]
MKSRTAIQPVPAGPSLGIRLGQSALATAAESLQRHRLLLLLVLGYAVGCYAVGIATGSGAVINIGLYNGVFGLLLGTFMMVLVVGSIVRVMARRPAGSLSAAIWRDFSETWLGRRRIATMLVPLLLAPVFFSTFSSFKSLIPVVAPFSWDEAFVSLDRWLHFGVHPWELLQPLFGTPVLTSALNAIYNAWYFVMFFVFAWQVVSLKRPALRMQFLISFVLYWIVIGTGLAMLFSSVGPCYYGRVTGLADPYVPLMQYLHAAAAEFPVWALPTQEMLWQAYQSKEAALGAGISAMPSMHVAIAVLLALFGWQVGRGLGIALTVFALLIQLGSVHLAWHYAIDGYVSAIAGVIIWYAVGWALRRAGYRNENDARPASPAG